METKSIEFHPDAVLEAAAGREWYSDSNLERGEAVADELEVALERVRAAPHSWARHLHGTQCVQLSRFPYLLVYRNDSYVILIVAVQHAKQRPGYWRERI